jgi:hypothetical protein
VVSFESPAATLQVQYGQAKQFLMSDAPAARRFQASIIGPQQREIDALRSQVDRLNGVLHQSDPEYVRIVRTLTARFAMGGGVKLFDKRAKKLKDMEADLVTKSMAMETLLMEISELRITCAMYAQQVDADCKSRGSLKVEQDERVERMEREIKQKQQAREEKLQRERERFERVSQPFQLRGNYMTRYMPASASSLRQDADEDGDVV